MKHFILGIKNKAILVFSILRSLELLCTSILGDQSDRLLQHLRILMPIWYPLPILYMVLLILTNLRELSTYLRLKLSELKFLFHPLFKIHSQPSCSSHPNKEWCQLLYMKAVFNNASYGRENIINCTQIIWKCKQI